jgi:plastocyanin
MGFAHLAKRLSKRKDAPGTPFPGAFFFIVAGFVLLTTLARAEPKIHTVRIRNMEFEPSQISVNAGDTVIFENRDDVPHAVHRRDGGSPPLDSGRLAPGKAFSFPVRGVTSILYEDRIHPEMRGSIVVLLPR